MKAWLSRAGIPFVVKDVEEEMDAYDELLAFGLRTVPVTVIGGERIQGFDEAALATAVARWSEAAPERHEI